MASAADRGLQERRLLQLLGFVLLVCSSQQVVAQDCSATQPCANNLCCSQWGFCGDNADYCGTGCVNNCWSSGTPGTGSGVGSIITQSLYNQFFLHTNDGACSPGFYTYSAFITAASAFPGFGTAGDATTNKRELAAFLAQVSHETTGGWPSAPDGPYAWGLCFKKEVNCPANGYCDQSTVAQWPCASGKSYCGRGPMQLSWNYNYGQAGTAIGSNLLANPELVENDAVISWKTAIWFWMTAQSPKPSAHAAMTGQWTPSAADQSANRLPGFGVTTNIINGGLECGHGTDSRVQDRIGFFNRYAGLLGVSTGNNVDCANQTPWT